MWSQRKAIALMRDPRKIRFLREVAEQRLKLRAPQAADWEMLVDFALWWEEQKQNPPTDLAGVFKLCGVNEKPSP